MTAPFPTIPSTGKPFFVSDSFSLTFDGLPGYQDFVPGVCHQHDAWNAGDTIFVYVTDAMIAALPTGSPSDSAVNIDGRLGIYDVSGGGAVFTGTMLQLTEPYVGNPRTIWIVNSTFKYGQQTPGLRTFGIDKALRLTATMPEAGFPGPFQIGPQYRFHNDGINSAIIEYEHWWQGVIASE